MRRHKLLSIILLLIICIVFNSCHKPVTLAILFITNKTEDTLFVESNIISPVFFDSPFDIKMWPNEDWREVSIAESKTFKGHIDYNLNVDDLVVNKDEASVKVYLVSGGRKELVKEWTYANRKEPGRQLFNEKSFSEPYISIERNYQLFSYVFDILPEDIGK